MCKYEYVSISAKGVVTLNYAEHRKIIDDYARRGYRYVGYIPTKQTAGFGGAIVEMDLIFEKAEKSA